VNADVVGALGIPVDVIQSVAGMEQRELVRREQAFRGTRPFPVIRDAVVILVDDGVATGSTMLAAVRALREQRPALLVAAAPVMSVSARELLEREVDACITLATPEPFGGVGAWYDDFRQTTDAEVQELLRRPPQSEPDPTEQEVAGAFDR